MAGSMKQRLLDYFTQRTTWMAIGAAALVVISYVKPEWTSMAAGILSAFGLVAKDKQE